MYNIRVNSKLCWHIIKINLYNSILTDIYGLDCGDNQGHMYSCHTVPPELARSVYGWPWGLLSPIQR